MPGDPTNLLHGARRLAEEHRMYIVEVTEKGEPAWVVYRKATGGEQRNTRLCRCSSPEALYRKMKKLARAHEAALQARHAVAA